MIPLMLHLASSFIYILQRTGLVKMYQPQMMAPSPGAQKPTIERNTPSSAVVNAHQSPGMLAAVTAADLAVQKLQQSKDNNISMVASYNTSTSSGQLGFYVSRMAAHGYVGIALCNSPEFVAAAPGGKGVFGTNPLAVGVPMPDGQAPFTVRETALPFLTTATHLWCFTIYHTHPHEQWMILHSLTWPPRRLPSLEY